MSEFLKKGKDIFSKEYIENVWEKSDPDRPNKWGVQWFSKEENFDAFAKDVYNWLETYAKSNNIGEESSNAWHELNLRSLDRDPDQYQDTGTRQTEIWFLLEYMGDDEVNRHLAWRNKVV